MLFMRWDLGLLFRYIWFDFLCLLFSDMKCFGVCFFLDL